MPLIAGVVAAPIAGGIIGNIMSQDDQDKSRQAYQDALNRILGVTTPDMNQMKVSLQSPDVVGKLNPVLEKAILQDPSLMANISTDPRLKDAQMMALGKLSQVGSQGLRPEDLTALNKIQNSVAQQEQANEQSILQNMQQRGIGGSGAELAARLNSSQAAANRASQQGLDIAGQASQNALQAIMNSGTLGGQMQGQEFSQKAQQAAAQDAINRYNAMNSQNVQGSNVSYQNRAQEYNLGNAQRIADMKAQIANEQEMHNKSLPELQYQNQLQKAQSAAGATGGLANNYQQSAARTQQMYSGIGQGIGQGAAMYGAYGARQKPATTGATPELPSDYTQNNFKYPNSSGLV